MNKISAQPQFQIFQVNQTGCTKFPTKKQLISLFILSLFQLEAIIIKIPFQLNNLDLPLFLTEVILVTIILISWYSTLAIHPGPKNDIRQFQFTSAQQIIKKSKNNCQLKQNQFQICKICKLKKDQSIQHCQKCNRCVLNYYFHINWLNTCVGKQNFPSFLSLIVFMFLYQLLLLVSNFVILLTDKNDRDNLLQVNNEFMILTRIINKIFIGVLVILIIVTITALVLKKNKLKKQKKQLKNKLKQNHNEIERKLNKERTEQNNQHFTETVVQTDSIRQLQFHENTLHSVQYDQPSLFKTNFFSSSNYFKHKKQSVEVKAQKFQNQLNLQDSKSKYARSMKSHSRQYSDSFQAQNMRLEQLIQIQKIKEHKLEIKTSKFCQQKYENKAQISLDLIKTKPKLQIINQQLQNKNQKFYNQNKQLKIQNQQPCSPAQLSYKVIKGKRKSISKLEDSIQKEKKKKFNLFVIRKKDSFNDLSKEEFHRISKMSS